ncbi:MAG: DPP IV N-terminal domain-containing protein [Gemmatimonadota bacterium]
MRRHPFLVTLCMVVCALPLAAQQRIAGVEQALGLSSQLAGRSGPAGVSWIDDGSRFSYLTRNPQSGSVEVRGYDPSSADDELLFDAGGLRVPGTDQPLQYRSLAWSADSRHVVFQTDFRPIYRRSGISDFYVYDVDDGSLTLAADDARTGEPSPDGSLFGYEREGDLYVYDMADGAERRLTATGTEDVWNGVFDWVYEEEFGRAQAWTWSPDSRRIAYWQTHVAETPTIQITDWEGQYPSWTVMPFPKVGQPNSVVEIGVVDVDSGETRWMDLGIDGEYYVPRIYWTNRPNTLAVVTLNRPQNELALYFFDVTTGERRLVMQERSDAWIDVYDFFAGSADYFAFPQGVDEFFWISDRDGYNHLYRYSYDGELLNQVTTGDWVVTRVEGIDVDSRTIYYVGTEESPLERHLYAIGFDGSDKRRLTREEGTHSINMSPNTAYFIDSWSNTTHPRRVELWSTAQGGRMLRTLEANSEVEALVSRMAYSPVELFSFTTSDGVELDGSMIRPPDFDRTRPHPVLVSIYGGPGSQAVYDRWATNGWHQYLAQQGYIVVDLNNRGSGNYGRDFMEIVYRQLGRWEALDFAELGRWLASQPWVDGDHMAIMGTSYGGFMATGTLLRHPGVFSLGIANSPVTDWRLYDTIYTERYMGLLDDNSEGYESSSLMSRADALEDHLLLIHSGMDENVQPQHTMQLLTALARAGKDADFRFYPPGEHGAAFDYASYLTMNEVYTNELCEFVAASCTPANLNSDDPGSPIF